MPEHLSHGLLLCMLIKMTDRTECLCSQASLMISITVAWGHFVNQI